MSSSTARQLLASARELSQALAALRNAILSLLRRHGWANIAAASRYYDASVERALALIGALPARL